MSQSEAPAPDSGPRASRPAVPTIHVEVGAPPFAAALAALRADPHLFVRGAELVHVVRTDAEEAEDPRLAVPPGTPRIHVASSPNVRARLCQRAVWTRNKTTKDGTKVVVTEPTRAFAEELLSWSDFPGLRVLDGVAETPFPRPDGTVCQVPGWDRATRYLYAPGLDFPPVADHPSQADAAGALALLLDLFADFPFATEAGRAAAVAALLTLVCRPAIRGPVPAFIVDATTKGTGKTLLADRGAAVASGRGAGYCHFSFTTGLDGGQPSCRRC